LQRRNRHQEEGIGDCLPGEQIVAGIPGGIREKRRISFVIAVFFKYEPTKHNQLHTELFLNPWALYPVSEELSKRHVEDEGSSDRSQQYERG